MIISEGRTVAITYTLTLDNGDTIDSNVDDEPLTYTHGTETLIAGLEKALEGLRRGDSASVHIQPEEGYGPVIEDALIRDAARPAAPGGRTVGARITAVSGGARTHRRGHRPHRDHRHGGFQPSPGR